MLVSVIIPCYNVQDFIEECLRSVFNQTYREIEVICVDNNSVDGTLELLKKIANDPKVPFPIKIVEEILPGASTTRNKGFSQANGEWIQFLDADDLLEPQKIQRQLDLIKKANSEALGFVAGACKRLRFNSTKITVWNDISSDRFLAPFVNKLGNTCSNLWKRDVITEVGGWNIDIKSSQETDLMMRVILAGYNYIIDEVPATIIRERESGQISQGDPVKRIKQYIDIRLNYISQLQIKSKPDFERLQGTCYDFLMVSVIELAGHDKSLAIRYYNDFIKGNWNSAHTYGFNNLKYQLIKRLGLNAFLRIRR